MITRAEILGTEELLLERNPRAAEVYRIIAERSRAAIVDLVKRYESAADDAALERFNAELENITTRAIAEYAQKASGLFSAEDRELWTSKITRVSGSYVARAATVGVPGALLLIDSFEEAELGDEEAGFVSLDSTLANGVEYCQCGYASTRTVPQQFCQLCSEALLNEWKAEEARLLAQAPALDADLNAVFDDVLDRLANINLDSSAPSISVSARRTAGDTGLAPVNDAHAAEIALLDVARWHELADLNGLSATEVIRADRKHWSRWGLGSARMSSLTLYGSPEIEKRMRAISGGRPAPKPTFFERLFSRK